MSRFPKFLVAVAVVAPTFLSHPVTAQDDTAAAQTADAQTTGTKVLRHAVFFDFKDEAFESDIKPIVDAFDGLPKKIDAIKGYERGINLNSGASGGGYTHAFLLSFADEKGRETYLPHPDHKAFGGVLRPHLKSVFVIDYWGQTAELKKPHLKHAVFFKFKADADPKAIADVEQSFVDLAAKIDTIRHFEWGKNNSPEKHDQGFTHAFMVTFDDLEDLAAYGPHPAHKELVEKLNPVIDEVRVIDFQVR
jgi:Stress responsive A/B Barrel Domain